VLFTRLIPEAYVDSTHARIPPMRGTRISTYCASSILVGVVALLGCSNESNATQCVSVGDAEVCGTPDGGAVQYTASGLEPGSTVTFTEPSIGTNEIAVSESGGFDGKVGLLSASGSYAGTISVVATAADGTALVGDLTFD
jgi:hypothetical protein